MNDLYFFVICNSGLLITLAYTTPEKTSFFPHSTLAAIVILQWYNLITLFEKSCTCYLIT